MDRERIARAGGERAPETERGDAAFDVVVGQAVAMMAPVGHFDRVHRTAEQRAQHEQDRVVRFPAQADRSMEPAMRNAQPEHEHRAAREHEQRPAAHGTSQQRGGERDERQREFARDLGPIQRDEIAPLDRREARVTHDGLLRGAGADRGDAR